MQNLQEIDTMTPHGGAREGAGRPQAENPRKPTSFALTAEELATLDGAAKSLGLSRSEYMRRVIGLSDVIVAIIRQQQAGDD